MRRFTIPLLLLILGGGTARVTAAPPDGVELLRKTVTQEDHVAFQGRQVTLLWEGDRSEAMIAQEAHDGEGRTRVETFMPRRQRGQLTLSDGKVEWHYDPATRKAIRVTDVPPEVELDDLDPLLNNYEVRVGPKPETVAGRRAWVVLMKPRTEGKPHRRLWIDSETGIILKQEKFHADNEPIDTSYFTRIRFHEPASSLFEYRFPAGTRRIVRAADSQSIRLGAVNAQFGVNIPDALPDGYEFESAKLFASKGKRAVQLRFRDGLSSVSLFLTPHSGTAPYGSRSGGKVQLRGGEGRLVREHHITALAWRTPRVDCELVGDVSDTLLRALAESTNLTQGAHESHHGAFPRFLWLVPAALFLVAGIIAVTRRLSPRVHLAERAGW